MKSVGISIIVIAAAVIGITACASSPPAAERTQVQRTCVKVRLINSFNVLDNQHVVVDATASDYYLLTLERGCSGLNFARGITIADQSSRVCNDRSSWLAFQHPGVGAKRCRIMNVEAVADARAAKALVAARSAD